MSRYTIQVRHIVDQASQFIEDMSHIERIDYSLPTIFNFDYPIWDSNARPILERQILLHYYMKEICCETIGLWQLYLQDFFTRKMPYYNDLYLTVERKWDYLRNIDLTEEYDENNLSKELAKLKSLRHEKGVITGLVNDIISNTVRRTDNLKTTQNDTTTAESKQLGSDLPQANFSGLDYGTNMTENDSTTRNNGTTDNTGTQTNQSDGTNKTTTDNNTTTDNTVDSESNNTGEMKKDFKRHQYGYSGKSPTELVEEYRKSIINIIDMIVKDEELKQLFMLIY